MSNAFNEPRSDTAQDVPETKTTDADTTQHDETDVPMVTETHHGDGPGEEAPATSDFEGFPEPDVQDEDDEEYSK